MRRPTRGSRSSSSSANAASDDGRPKRRAAKPDFFKYQLVNNPSKAEKDALKRALQESLEEHDGPKKGGFLNGSCNTTTLSTSESHNSSRNNVSMNSSDSSSRGNNNTTSSSRNNNGTSKGNKFVARSSTNSSNVSSRNSSHINSSTSSNESVGNIVNQPTSKRTRSHASLTPTPPPSSVSASNVSNNNTKRAKFTSPASTNGHSKQQQELNNNNTNKACDTNTSVLPQVTRAIKTYSRSQQSESPQRGTNNIVAQQDQKTAQNQKQSPRDSFKSSTPIADNTTSNLTNGSSTPKPTKKTSPKQVSVSRSTQTPNIRLKTGINLIQKPIKAIEAPTVRLAINPPITNSSGAANDVTQSTSGKTHDQHVKSKRDKEKKTSKESEGVAANNSIKFIKQRPPQGSWSLLGLPEEKVIYIRDDMPPKRLICYPAIKHVEGDVIQVKDSVLLRSGAKNTDLPYIAKVYAFWEDAETGNVMMSLFWYYRPEHTEEGRKPHHLSDEIFASRHRDADSVECIEDKCYVLTFNEYCRYRKRCKMEQVNTTWSLTDVTIPVSNETYPRRNRIPDSDVNPELVFCCRQIYDSRSRRLLKNPLINSKYGHI